MQTPASGRAWQACYPDDVPASDFVAILTHLQSSRFQDITGARVSATIPVSERLLNEIVAATMPRNLPVREVSVRPEAGNRFSVRLTPRAAMLPQLTIKLDIEKQPEFPASPFLVLRMATMGGLFGMATAAFPIGKMLPPGVHLDGERIVVDLRALATQHGYGQFLEYVRTLHVTTEAARVLLHLDGAVG